VRKTFLEAILWNHFQLFRRIPNDVSSITKATSRQCCCQSGGTGKSQLETHQESMKDALVLSLCSLLRNPRPKPTGVLEDWQYNPHKHNTPQYMFFYYYSITKCCLSFRHRQVHDTSTLMEIYTVEGASPIVYISVYVLYRVLDYGRMKRLEHVIEKINQ
jgi:hypothetical protein